MKNTIAFKKLLNSIIISGIYLFSGLIVFSCSNQSSQGISHSDIALGTRCTATVYSKADLRTAKELFSLVHETEARMSTKLETSEISLINSLAGKEGGSVSPETLHVIERGIDYSALSGGRFDITVGPLVSLWGIATDTPRVPQEEELASVLGKIGYSRVRLDRDDFKVFLPDAGMALDLGAIAKGWAIDKYAAGLRESGVSRALLNFGGNVYTLGKKEDGTPWRIGVQDPWNPRGNYIGILKIGEMAVATSGKYERYFIEDGNRYHHVLDTASGYPIENGVASVSIVSPEAMEADALSTVVFALGLKEGYELLNKLPGREGVIVTDSKDVYVTPGLYDDFILTDHSYNLIPSGVPLP